MDYDMLLKLAMELGVRLQKSGAEIYRVEESVVRLLAAYGVSGEVFAIPNCLIVSLTTGTGEQKTALRRIPSHGTDIELLEAYNDLCRKLCHNPPPEQEALDRVFAEEKSGRDWPFYTQLCAYFVGTGGFSLFFGGTWADAACSGLCGMAICCCLKVTRRLRASLFNQTVFSAFVSSLLAAACVYARLAEHVPFVTIGALMALVPGVLFTNSMRDIMAGDMVAGLVKLVESMVIGGAIALGTGAGLALARAAGGL
ncbi:MAG: hypothetical protein H6Q60_37 [Oscillospiraceae bacterium]|nr:hypothetical protein [Oscillospiraceae bacterium]